MENFKIIELIGISNNEKLYKAIKNKKNYFLKIIEFKNYDKINIIKEILINEILYENNNILLCYQKKEKKEFIIIYKFLEFSLKTILKNDLLKENHKDFILFQILLLLNKLHKNNIIYNNLKLENILLNKNSICYFSNFNRSIINNNINNLHSFNNYLAPEILFGNNKYNDKIDIWAFGCLICELILKKPLFSGNCVISLSKSIINLKGNPKNSNYNINNFFILNNEFEENKLNKIFKNINKNLLEIILSCLEFNYDDRPSSEELLNCNYFKNLNFKYEKINKTNFNINFTDKEKNIILDNYINNNSNLINILNSKIKKKKVNFK